MAHRLGAQRYAQVAVTHLVSICAQAEVHTYSVVEVPLFRLPVAAKHERPVQERVAARHAPPNVERNRLRPRHTAPPRPSVGSQAAQRLDQLGRPLGHDGDAQLEVPDLELPRGSKALHWNRPI